MSPVVLLAYGLDVSELAAWIGAIPFTEWPAGSLVELRPAMVTDQSWHGFSARTDALVARLISIVGGSVHFTNRWLSVVMPGHSIEPHADAAEPGWVTRVHVPLISNERAILTANGEPYHLDVGSAYRFDKTSQHSVRNDGETARVHLMFEVIADDIADEG